MQPFFYQDKENQERKQDNRKTATGSESIMNKDNPLFIRRIKEDLNDFEGKPLFLPRR